MKRSFLRNHIVAWMAAIVLAYVGAGVLNAIPPKLLLHYPFIGPVLPVFVIVTLIEIFVAWRVAILLDRFDPLLLVAVALISALAFGASYSTDVRTFLPDNGHTFFDVGTWGARPFDFWGQFEIFAFILAWAIFTIGAGIALKRLAWNSSAVAAPSPGDSGKMILWLAFDLVLIVGTTFAILRTEVVNRIAVGKPENIYEAAVQVLQSKASSEGDRAQAILKLGEIRSEAATDLLRHAARDEPEPINIVAAAELLGRDDLVGLPLIAEYLVHSSQVKTAYSSTTKSPLGVASISGFNFQLNLASYLRSVKDPAALPILIRLMSSDNAEIRLGTVQGIRNMNSPEMIDPLVKGLDDPDPKVRQSCMWGLGLFLGRDQRKYGWHPPHYDSPQDEQQIYLDSFKTWAKQRTSGTTSP